MTVRPRHSLYNTNVTPVAVNLCCDDSMRFCPDAETEDKRTIRDIACSCYRDHIGLVVHSQIWPIPEGIRTYHEQ